MENTPSPSTAKYLASDTPNTPVRRAVKPNNQETHQVERATSSQSQPRSATSPEHVAVVAALRGAIRHQMAVHERLQFGGEVNLAPIIDHQSTVNIVFKDGVKEVVFTVHSDLLSYYSPHFHKTLNGGGVTAKALIRSKMLRREWRWERNCDIESMEGNGYGDEEGKVQVDVRIKLPGASVRNIDLSTDEVGDIGARSVAAFIDWLYKGFAGFTFDNYAHMKYSSTELIKLWVLAGKLGVPACQNHCIEGIELLRFQTGSINTGMIGWVYGSTKGMRGNEKLKKLLVDQCAWRLHGPFIMGGGLGDDFGVPRDAIIHILGRVMLMAQSNVNFATDAPPFARIEWRKHLYWIEDSAYENDANEADPNEDGVNEDYMIRRIERMG